MSTEAVVSVEAGPPAGSAAVAVAEVDLARELFERARRDGVDLVGPGGLLTDLTKTVLETALGEELTEHLGYGPHERSDGSNARNGSRQKTVLTEIGPVTVEVPRDRDGSFEPRIVRKRQRRLAGVDELVISLAAKGLTNTGSDNYGGPVATASGLLFIAATNFDKKFRAFESSTGKLLWEATLPAAGNATPSIYEIKGRQYIAIACGGGKNGAPSGSSIVAFALPPSP